MAKIDWVHHRLERWALWAAGGQGKGCHPMWRSAEPGTEGARREALVPVNSLEASADDEAIKRLRDPLKETVQMYYLHDSSYTQRKLCITRATLSARISTAHRLLAADWTTPKPRATYDLKRSWD
jgi:hypothetical protein